jgi:hypothetical protein
MALLEIKMPFLLYISNSKEKIIAFKNEILLNIDRTPDKPEEAHLKGPPSLIKQFSLL